MSLMPFRAAPHPECTDERKDAFPSRALWRDKSRVKKEKEVTMRMVVERNEGRSEKCRRWKEEKSGH